MSNNLQNALATSVAVLLVLVTLYFTTHALKRNYQMSQLKLEEAHRLREYEQEQQKLIRDQLMQKEIQRQADILAKLKEHQRLCYDLQIFTSELDYEEEEPQLIQQEQESINGQTNQILLQQPKKTNRKKDLSKAQQPKKGQSTEPIIYLFVLVFLYLLLKAASDITQHYKEQSKGDKRNNRRCSLQVYAQMKNERRSSKGIGFTNILKYFKFKS